MKRTLCALFLATIALALFTECSKSPSFIPNTGKVVVLNGQGKYDTITYTCDNCDSLLSDTALFHSVVRKANEEAKNSLKFPRTFVPEKIELNIIRKDGIELVTTDKLLDSVLVFDVKSKFIGKTAMGVEKDSESESRIFSKDGKIIDVENNIKLDSLAFIDNLINRGLLLYDESYEYIHIIPYKNGTIIVLSSLGCVDENSGLHIMLENGDIVRRYSWNDFNCEGKSYFNGFNINDLEILRKNQIEMVRFSSDDKSLSFFPANNQKDYFIQLSKLITTAAYGY